MRRMNMADNESLYEQNIKQLREKTEQEMLQMELKKNFLGGLNQREVISYVNGVREQAQRAEETFKKRIKELTDSREALRTDYRSLKDQLSDTVKRLSEYEKNTRLQEEKLTEQAGLGSRLNELAGENSRLIDTVRAFECNIKDLEDKIQQLEAEKRNNPIPEQIILNSDENDARLVELTRLLYDQKKLCLDQEQQIKRDEVKINKLTNEKSELEKVTAGMREDISRNYSQLEEQIKANHKLATQLESERQRSSAAEKYIGEIEEKLYTVNDINFKYKDETVRLHEEMYAKYEEIEEGINSQINEIINNFRCFRTEIAERNLQLREHTAKAESETGSIMESIELNYRKDNIIDLPKYKQG
jgi:chromosome segregation ATPase